MLKQSTILLALCGLMLATSLRAEDEKAAPKKSDPVGVWKWEDDYGHGTVHSTLTLKKLGKRLTGTYENDEGSHKLEEVTVEGDKVTCKFKLQADGNDMAIHMEGTIQGNDITGKINADVGGETSEFDWKAKRDVSHHALVGQWRVNVIADTGQTYNPVLVFEEKNGKLSGTYASLEFGKHPLDDITVEGNKIAFVTKVDFGGAELELNFAGELNGEKMKGTLEYDAGGTTGEGKFNGELSKTKIPGL